MPDPLDVLRQPVVPVAPRPQFARHLRRRLTAALDAAPTPSATDHGDAMTMTDSPSTLQSLRPYLCIRGAARAIEFYKEAFGAVEAAETYIDTDGRIGHAELRIGQAVFSLADEYDGYGQSPEALGDTTVQLHLYVPDVDRVVERAVAAGAELLRPVDDQPYGDRSGAVRDPFGHRWIVATHVEDLALDELQRRNAPGGFTVERPSRRGELFYFMLAVRDLDRAKAFYGRLLGWGIEEQGHIASTTQPGGIHETDAEPQAELCLIVDDIHEAVETVRDLGGTADEPVLYDSGWMAVCRDDQGTPFNLSVPADGY